MRKGIILAGGSGTRLYPTTLSISKQLVPVYDKPMIYYPLSVLMLSDIKEILLISTPQHIELYKILLGDGSNWGLSISYEVQPSPGGLSQAFLIGENFINNHPCCLILGDNIFHGANLEDLLLSASNEKDFATIFAYKVSNPEQFGVIEFDSENNVKNIIEKPENPKSDYAATGIYFYDENVVSYAKTLKPSKRGELEITDLNNIYLEQNKLKVKLMSRGYAWLDTGNYESLTEASQFVYLIEKRQGNKICCPEEIALKKGWISKKDLLANISGINGPYVDYLRKLVDEF
mgnify:CR=1 FL=1